MARTDIHRPAEIIPADYEFVAADYYGPHSDEFMKFERANFRKHMEHTGGKFSDHEHGGTCYICGAAAMYVAKFYHAKSNTYIVTGEECAAKLEYCDPALFRRIHQNAKRAREAAAGKARAQAILKEAGIESAWDLYVNNGSDKYEENTIRNIVSNLVKYGTISDKQISFVRTLVLNIANRGEIEKRRKEEYNAAKEIPEGDERILIQGKVLSIKEGDYGPRILVQSVDGWKVFGKLPSNLFDVARGDDVEFSAKVTRSKDDTKFGFFSRPTKARIVE